MKTPGYVYLATPYAHADAGIMLQRYEQALQFTAEALSRRFNVYSPIVHNHEIALHYENSGTPLGNIMATNFRTFQFWEKFDFAMLERADELWIYQLPGWSESKGIAAEKMFWERELGRGDRIRFIGPEHVNWVALRSAIPTQQPEDPSFIKAINDFADSVHATARDRGWWDTPRDIGTLYMLMVTELAEGFEGMRKGGRVDDHCPAFTNEEIELADTIIRILDYAASRGYAIGDAIYAKSEFNKTRPHRHGGKLY